MGPLFPRGEARSDLASNRGHDSTSLWRSRTWPKPRVPACRRRARARPGPGGARCRRRPAGRAGARRTGRTDEPTGDRGPDPRRSAGTASTARRATASRVRRTPILLDRLHPRDHQHLLRPDAGAQGRARSTGGSRPSTTPARAAFTETPTDIASTCRRPASPSLPPPAAAIMPPVAPPVISWDAVAGAIGYDVEIDAEGDGVGGTLRPASRPRPTSGRTRRASARTRARRTSSSGCAPSSTTTCRRPGPPT